MRRITITFLDISLMKNMEPTGGERSESISTLSSSHNSLRSTEATYAVYIQFINATERYVDVIWIDYIGQWVRYETLSPGGEYEVYTYVSHPWVFLDGESGIRLVAIERGKVFYPLMSDVKHELDEDGVNRLMPVKIVISVPVFSLKERCVEVMCQLVYDRNLLHQLPLPKEVIREIEDAYDAPNNYTVIDSSLTETDEEENGDQSQVEDEGFNEEDLDADGEADGDTADEEDDGDDDWEDESDSYVIEDGASRSFDDLHPLRSLLRPLANLLPVVVSNSPVASASSSCNSYSCTSSRVNRRFKPPPEHTSTDDDATIADDEANDDDDNDNGDDDDEGKEEEEEDDGGSDSFHSAQSK